MSTLEKQIERLKSKPKDFTYDEAKMILNNLGFVEDNKGKTFGSRAVFKNFKLNKKIELYKPHPKNILRPYQINRMLKLLKEWRIL